MIQFLWLFNQFNFAKETQKMSKLSLTQVKMLAELLGMEYGQKRVDSYREGDIGEFDTDENPSLEMTTLMEVLRSDLHGLTVKEQCEMVTTYTDAWLTVTGIYHEECKAKYPPVKITNYHAEIF
jgi:hypothetical protein